MDRRWRWIESRIVVKRDAKQAQPPRLCVFVTPRSARPGIGDWRAGADGREALEVRVAEAPADGAANDAVVRLLAKALGISSSEVEIVSGYTSRNKRIATPFDGSEVIRRLSGSKEGDKHV
jgi:uncharacterized protein